MAAQTSRKGAKPTAKFPPIKDFALLVCPNGAVEHAGATSDEMFKQVSRKVNPIQSKIVLRRTTHIPGGGINIHTNSAEDLARLEKVVKATGLQKDIEVT